MAGTTDQEKRGQDLDKQLGGILNQVGGINFDKAGQLKYLEDLLKGGEGDILRQSNRDISDFQKGTTGRFASQGIGGAMEEEAQRAGASAIGRNRTDALSGLKQYGISEKMGLNDKELDTLFKKYGLMQSVTGQQTGLLGSYDDTTWFDDVLSVANTVGGFIPGIGGIGSAIGSLFGGGDQKPTTPNQSIGQEYQDIGKGSENTAQSPPDLNLGKDYWKPPSQSTGASGPGYMQNESLQKVLNSYNPMANTPTLANSNYLKNRAPSTNDFQNQPNKGYTSPLRDMLAAIIGNYNSKTPRTPTPGMKLPTGYPKDPNASANFTNSPFRRY